MPSVRTFLSFDPPPAVVAHLSAFQARLRASLTDVAWVRPDQFHCTLAFLGEVDETLLPALLREVAAAARRAHPFDVSYEGLGVFPDRVHPAVLWVGCVNADGLLRALKWSLDEAVRRAGVSVSAEPFRPHLTLGRARSARPGDLIPMWESLTLEPRKATIGMIQVMKSSLSPQGAEHSVLAANPLSSS